MMSTLDEVVALAKRRGFVFPGSEIYGGLANVYDYGPMGAELLKNIKDAWWRYFITSREDMLGINTSILTHESIWKASGHLTGFVDAMVDCKSCQLRTRADHLIEGFTEKAGEKRSVEGMQVQELSQLIQELEIRCPGCGERNWTEVRHFNLLFPVQLGILASTANTAYLRGETAQGIFTQFQNILSSNRVKLPFGVGQIGKSFRNEITKGNFIFRTLEFEQAEIEYFFDPSENNWETLFSEWRSSMWEFVTKTLGIREENLRWREHSDEERSFYSLRTEDLEYNYPFGFGELWGLAYRTDYDLTQHIKESGKDLKYYNQDKNERVVPHVIEPAVGIDRLFLMVLCDAYTVEESGRTVLKLSPELAPYQYAVFPLLANKPELVSKAREVFDQLRTRYRVSWDARGNIGKRYLAQDEVGTPACITIDFQTLEDETVTIRNRDTTEQKRVQISELMEGLR